MICPECQSKVDPENEGHWVKVLDSSINPNALTVLEAIDCWDQSCMVVGGHSVLPTELRDAVRAVIHRRKV
jgi:hypothetical protein